MQKQKNFIKPINEKCLNFFLYPFQRSNRFAMLEVGEHCCTQFEYSYNSSKASLVDISAVNNYWIVSRNCKDRNQIVRSHPGTNRSLQSLYQVNPTKYLVFLYRILRIQPYLSWFHQQRTDWYHQPFVSILVNSFELFLFVLIGFS